MDTKAIVGVVVAIAVALLLLAYVLPVGMNGMEEKKSTSYTIAEGETINLTRSTVYLSDVDPNNGDVNLTVNNTEADTSTSINTLSTGDEVTKTLGDLGDITIKNVKKVSNTEVELKITTAVEYGWSSGTQDIFGVIPILAILVILGLMAGWVMKELT